MLSRTSGGTSRLLPPGMLRPARPALFSGSEPDSPSNNLPNGDRLYLNSI